MPNASDQAFDCREFHKCDNDRPVATIMLWHEPFFKADQGCGKKRRLDASCISYLSSGVRLVVRGRDCFFVLAITGIFSGGAIAASCDRAKAGSDGRRLAAPGLSELL